MAIDEFLGKSGEITWAGEGICLEVFVGGKSWLILKPDLDKALMSLSRYFQVEQTGKLTYESLEQYGDLYGTDLKCGDRSRDVETYDFWVAIATMLQGGISVEMINEAERAIGLSTASQAEDGEREE